MYDDLLGLLTTYIYDESYADGIASLRKDMAVDRDLYHRWCYFTNHIKNRDLLPEQPLALVHHGANKVLKQNTDDEAYQWLVLLIHNVERTDGLIEPY